MVGEVGSILEIKGGILIHQVWFAFILFYFNQERNICVLKTQKLKAEQSRTFQECFHFDIKTSILGMYSQLRNNT